MGPLHRAGAWIILHFEVPLIHLLLKLKLKEKVITIKPRHSLIEKGGFNLFMSDIDLSIVVKSDSDFNNALNACWSLKRVLLNLGEPEVYLAQEWETLENLKKNELDELWRSLFQIRKLKWQRERNQGQITAYQKAKFERGTKRSLMALNSNNGLLYAENIFPFLKNIPDERTDSSFPKWDDFIQHNITISPDNDQYSLIFQTPSRAELFQSLSPIANNILKAPWEKIRIYLLKRELLMARCHLRLLEWTQDQSSIPKIREWVEIIENKIKIAEPNMHNQTIEVVLKKYDKDETLSIFFNLLDTNIAAKYFKILKTSISRKDPIYEPDRTYNFPGDIRDNSWIANRLNECIDIINAYSHVIHHRAQPEMDQEHMNHLHKYFEVYRGPIVNPPTFFIEAPTHVKKALEEYNVLIHRYEDYNRNLEYVKNGQRPAAKIVVTYAKERALLADEDFQHFTSQVTFGRYYLNYCEVGKPIWDMYQDNDEVVGEENILPLKYYSADAMIEFSPSTSKEADEYNIKNFYAWWDRNMELMDGLGFKQHDPKNAIGHIPLADLDRNRGAIAGLNEREIIELIGQYPIISHLVAHENKL